MNRPLLFFAAGCFLSTGAWAAPAINIGNGSGQAGTAVDIPISLTPSTASISAIQFDLTLPAGVGSGLLTPSALLTASGKSVNALLNGRVWTFIIFGLNKNSIGSGTLLTARVNIASGTTAGTLTLPITRTLFSDPEGQIVPPGSSVGGTLTISGPRPVITSTLTATGIAGIAFSHQITASNTPTSFAATGLPIGLGVNTLTGMISGTPTTAGSSKVNLSATNAGGSGVAVLTLTISPPRPLITSTRTATGIVGTAFSYQMTASNSPTSFGAVGLPNGLAIAKKTGLISGIPTAEGNSKVNLSAANAAGYDIVVLTLTLSLSFPRPVITSPLTATGIAGAALSYQMAASNSPTSFAATGLPAGLVVNAVTGLISGTPTTGGSFKVNLSAANASGSGAVAVLTLTLSSPRPVITSARTAAGTVGTAFSYTITASNTPTSFGATVLPAGLSVHKKTGLIFGTPTLTGSSKVNLSAANAAGYDIVALTLTLSQPVITSTPTANALAGTTWAPGSPTAHVKVSINPWRSDRHGNLPITLSQLPPNATVKIFTVSAHWIKTLRVQGLTAEWDRTNDRGDKVASGIYIYLVTTDDGVKNTGQLVIIQ